MRTVAAPILAGFALRAALALVVLGRGPGAVRTADSDGYLALAETLATTGGFGAPERPELERTPGYPLFLVPGVLAGRPDGFAVVSQVALGTATIALVMALGRAVFLSDPAAVAAGWLLALDPVSILYGGKLLSETWFTVLLLGGLCLAAPLFRVPRVGPATVAGFLLAAAALVRPIGVVAIVVVGGSLLATGLRRAGSGRRQLLTAAAGFMVAAALPTGAWVARNWLRAGYPGFSAIGAVNLYFYVGAAIRGAATGVPYYEVQRTLGSGDADRYLARHPDQADWTAARRYRWMAAEGRRIVRAEPGLALRIHLGGVARTMLDPGAIEYLRTVGRYPAQGGLLGRVVDQGLVAAVGSLARSRPLAFWTTAAAGVILAGLLALAAGQLGRRALWHNPAAVTIALVAAALAFASGGPGATSRFRVPIAPILGVLAGAELARRWFATRPAVAGPS